jgi:large subunit ribosomal protein L4e
MKTQVFDIHGKKAKEIELPKCFSQKIRDDLILKVLESRKTKQPHSPSPVAGKQASAKGKIKHRRHVWGTHYGKGISRVPRKTMWRRGSQFYWVAAEAPLARGGMRAHPPKIMSMIGKNKINKKELKIAFLSALSATADEKKVKSKYASLINEKIEKLPLIVESNIISLKTKEFLEGLKKILGEKLYSVALPKKSIRSGKGKLRGRKYKKTAGLLLVTGEKEKIKTKTVDTKNVQNLNVTDLAEGSPGRLVLYTENAIKFLQGMENKK